MLLKYKKTKKVFILTSLIVFFCLFLSLILVFVSKTTNTTYLAKGTFTIRKVLNYYIFVDYENYIKSDETIGAVTQSLKEDGHFTIDSKELNNDVIREHLKIHNLDTDYKIEIITECLDKDLCLPLCEKIMKCAIDNISALNNRDYINNLEEVDFPINIISNSPKTNYYYVAAPIISLTLSGLITLGLYKVILFCDTKKV